MWKIAEIRLKQLEKSFEVSKNSHPVLRRFSTDLDTEKITVILGRSGCGKTTLLRVLAGLETLDGGQILFEQPEKLGVVFQEPRLMPWLTLEQNILFGADKKKHSKSKLKEKAETLLRLTGLEKFGKAYPDQLSGGMMQRAALARALACDASYLLMDEPFAALDHFTSEDFIRRALQEFPDVDGIFASSDLIASQVIQVGAQMDKRVPEDIQLVGFDDVMISTVTTPQITTIHQPVEEMAELCVEYITKSLKNEPVPQKIVLPVRLVQRGTTVLKTEI